MAMSRAYWTDLAERVGSTAGEAALGVLITQLGQVPLWWAALLIPVLSAAKAALAGHMTGSASLVAGRRPPVSPVPDPPAAASDLGSAA